MKELPLILLKIFIAISVAAIGVWAPALAQTPEQFVLLFVGIGCTLVVSLPIFLRRNYRIAEPLTFIVLLVIFGVQLKLAYIVGIAQSNNEYVAKRLLLWGTPDDFLWGSTVVLIALSVLVFVYEIRQPRIGIDMLFQPQIKSWSGKRMQLSVVAVFLFSITMMGLFIISAGINLSSLEGLSAKRFTDGEYSSASRMHTVKYYFYRGAALSKFVFYLSLAWVISRKQNLFSWMGVVMFISMFQTMLLFFMMGSRASIVLLLMDGLFLVYLIQRQLEVRKIAAAAGLILLLLLPMLASRDKSESRLAHLVEKTLAGRDMMDISKTCHIINAVPDALEYRYGETLYGWLAAPIPRSVWPEKPMWAERGTFLSSAVFGDKHGITGVPPGLIAELYWNLGLIGVVLGMVVMGIALKALYVTFLRNDDNPSSILIYTIIITRFTMFTFGNDLGTGILKAALDVIPLVFILWFVGLKDAPLQSESVEETTLSDTLSAPSFQTVPSSNLNPSA